MNFHVVKAVVGKTEHWVIGRFRKRAREPLFLLSLLCAISLASTTGHAQLTTADIIGTVYDASGAVLPNAKVSLTNHRTHQVRSAQSGSGGEYSFTFLLPGSYSVRVESEGFTTFTSTVEISAGDRARVDAPLKVGQTSESVEVVSQSPLLQT